MDIQHIALPVAGKDYPRNWNEFLDRFGSEEACLAYLEGLRWPQGFVCPSCGVTAPASRASRGRLLCKDCGHQSTVTAGTIFDKTRTPLRVWLAGAWYLTNQKLGVSALGLQRVLGLGSYQTAWTMLHRFRKAMVRRDRERLHGQVEVRLTWPSPTARHPFPLTSAQHQQGAGGCGLQPKGFASACSASTTTPTPASCPSCKPPSSRAPR
jgi:transposase-like protein